MKVDIVIMCVRPFDIKQVLEEIAGSVRDETLIVSLNGSVSFNDVVTRVATKGGIAEEIFG